MADITPVGVSNAGATLTYAATTVGGDALVDAPSQTVVALFISGHSSPITVNVAPTQSTGVVSGIGGISVPTRTMTIAAGARGVMAFSPTDKAAYLNSAGKIPITYTSGNTAMVVAALKI